MKSLILIGMPASGKSSIGKCLAKKLKFNFIDTDKLIELRENDTITNIFTDKGEDYFREIESEVFLNCLELDNVVISTGGGIVKNPKNFENIDKDKFVIVNIKRNIEYMVINDKRPLIKSKKDIYMLYNQRKNLYRKYADKNVFNNNFYSTVKHLIKLVNSNLNNS